ncbi:EcoAI/FtnUII family type I restriction enzme subunit R [Maridesulfovibrio salexigens]|uniref:Type I site-specific deoxyribonuclease n=1 Tax=Maridesulfovibrio salexigens (strain ATCC 14822 / DSM 2638 / NCIMB 8403 / VKM B-1763) TaxID=526222 RepID=C6BRN4_MARSD|nr:type I restriction endonuclease subunit R [Maridesulfovibrio salexigens]ACS79474.1 Type I site-specific deoxyribonuclease [Maridesulfovibrio salexigens DSM 2638]
MNSNRNEAETRAELIDPALTSCGWGKVDESRVKREVITNGRLIGGGRRGKQDIADYVLVYKGQKLAVIEAKRESLSDTEGVQQAKRYADKLKTRFAYSTNGHTVYRIDMETGAESHVDAFPTPQELWDETFAEENEWRNRFSSVPFEDKGGTWEARYYQHNAINQALEAIAAGKDRILLTLATGTGKTFIAFQLSWKLFHSRWNIKEWREGEEITRRPRILFLADRNILADQAYNSFSAFPEDALVRISPDAIRKKGMVPKNGNIFFTIFQTFMSGIDAEGNSAPNFGDYPPDFFDFIIIDECHRGGAKDESTWRGILEYFAPAVQLGLTATPRRTNNADTYGYFGDPVYTYSLKDGINDGFLTPFKVVQIATTLDEYVYTSDDEIIQGEVEEGKRYGENEFNRSIEIKAREEHRVKIFMDNIDQSQKTIVFGATQHHAGILRDIINQQKTCSDPNYCVRVVAQDLAEGEKWLRIFQDNEKTIPTILTTSQKLSTGVDARNVRNIVLLRPVNSMIEFKQIVGRGTRLFDGKDYFTIYDFVKAYEHFNDPEWDGEPVEPEPCSRCGNNPCTCEIKPPEPCSICGQLPCVCEKKVQPCPKCGEHPCVCEKKTKLKIKLADGKSRQIQHMMATTFWSTEGKPMSAAEFIKQMYGDLPELFKDEDELRNLWGKPDTRKKLLSGLEEKGYGQEQLRDLSTIINAEKSDLYDVLAYIAFALAPISREERVDKRKDLIFEEYSNNQQEFLSFVLAEYVSEGINELDDDKLPELLNLKYNSVQDAKTVLGSIAEIRNVFVGFQERLYIAV